MVSTADAFLPESDGRRGVEPLCAAYGPACAVADRGRSRAGRPSRNLLPSGHQCGYPPSGPVATLGDPALLFFNLNTPEDLAEANALWHTKIISIVGRKNAGKTSLIVALASEFTRRGRRVMTIKHAITSRRAGHAGNRHLSPFSRRKSRAGADCPPEIRAVIERSPDDTDPVTLARRYLADADIVLVEGFKRHRFPRWRYIAARSPTPLYDRAAPNAVSGSRS